MSGFAYSCAADELMISADTVDFSSGFISYWYPPAGVHATLFGPGYEFVEEKTICSLPSFLWHPGPSLIQRQCEEKLCATLHNLLLQCLCNQLPLQVCFTESCSGRSVFLCCFGSVVCGMSCSQTWTNFCGVLLPQDIGMYIHIHVEIYILDMVPTQGIWWLPDALWAMQLEHKYCHFDAKFEAQRPVQIHVTMCSINSFSLNKH